MKNILIITSLISCMFFMIYTFPIIQIILGLFVSCLIVNNLLRILITKALPLICGTIENDNIIIEFYEDFIDEAVSSLTPDLENNLTKYNKISYYLSCIKNYISSHLSYSTKTIKPQKITGSEHSDFVEIFQDSGSLNSLDDINIGTNDYSMTVALDSLQLWRHAPNPQGFIAYEYINGHKKQRGFIMFQERSIDDKPIIYIIELQVTPYNDATAKKLLDCVMEHVPVGMELYILKNELYLPILSQYQMQPNFNVVSQEEVTNLEFKKEMYIESKSTTSRLIKPL